jgi:hypothetical protein
MDEVPRAKPKGGHLMLVLRIGRNFQCSNCMVLGTPNCLAFILRAGEYLRRGYQLTPNNFGGLQNLRPLQFKEVSHKPSYCRYSIALAWRFASAKFLYVSCRAHIWVRQAEELPNRFTSNTTMIAVAIRLNLYKRRIQKRSLHSVSGGPSDE